MVLKRRSQGALDLAYTGLGSLLNCDPGCIAVVNSATTAWQRIFLGLPLWRPGSRIITSLAEYGSNFIAYLQVRPIPLAACIGVLCVQVRQASRPHQNRQALQCRRCCAGQGVLSPFVSTVKTYFLAQPQTGRDTLLASPMRRTLPYTY